MALGLFIMVHSLLQLKQAGLVALQHVGILVPGPGIEQASPELRSRFFITREFFVTSLLTGLIGVFSGGSWSRFSAYHAFDACCVISFDPQKTIRVREGIHFLT